MGSSVPKPIARWNPARDVWETGTTGLFCEHSDVWSETWPSSGMWAAGTVYELPTSAHHTTGSGCSLLPTPQTVDTQPAAPADMRRESPNLRAITKFLPTPRTSDTNGAGLHGTGGPDLRTVVGELLPTPSVADGMGGHMNRSGARSDELLLPGLVRTLTTVAATEDTETATEVSRSTESPSATDGITALLPTPTATPYGSNQSPSPGAAVRPSLDTLALTLLPTPRVGADRTSRSAATRRDSMSGPSLGQAVEIARGELPREFESWDELPPLWKTADPGA